MTSKAGAGKGGEGASDEQAQASADPQPATRGRKLVATEWDAEREAKYRAEKLARDLHLAKAHWQKPHVEFTGERRVEYLAALQVVGNHQRAADIVGVHVRTARKHREADKDFEADCEVAIERWRHDLVGEAVRRAVEGTDEPVFQGGELVGSKRVFSDRMLEVMLKAKGGPDFREKVGVEHSGDVGIRTGVLAIPAAAAARPKSALRELDDETGGGR